MSWLPCPDPVPGDADSVDKIDSIIVPRMRDIGGFEVGRVLPAAGHGMVGPFIFFDQMGPAEFLLHEGIDVRPHPHINLATVTYLFEGEITHRDSLNHEQVIRPGDVNWMTAGRGIVHSERSSAKVRESDSARLFGLQTWVALPADKEESEPSFEHTTKSALPMLQDNGVRARLVVGNAWGESSPVATLSDTLYVDAHIQPGGELPFDAAHEERAVYVVDGQASVDGQAFSAGRLLLVRPGARLCVRSGSEQPARVILIGGETMDGPRHIWWNFVSSRADRIEQARADWAAGRFDSVPGDAEEFTPLPPSAGKPRVIPPG